MMPERPLPPGSTIGILGGGQLGRMLAVAAAGSASRRTSIPTRPTRRPSTSRLRSTVGSYDDEDALARFAALVDVVTCEFENVPAATLEAAARVDASLSPAPSPSPWRRTASPRRTSCAGLGIRGRRLTPRSTTARSAAMRRSTRVKLPAILKTRRLGYDGKGQVLIRDATRGRDRRSQAHRRRAGRARRPRPVRARGVGASSCADRTARCSSTTWSRTCTRTASSPSAACRRASLHGIAVEANDIAGNIAEALDHVGVLAVEMFEREGEAPRSSSTRFAPRVHNSGHWTLDACLVSQFENHVRAICRLAARRDRPPQRCGDDQSDRRRCRALARSSPPSPASPRISTARPRRGQAARWATSPGSIPKS